MAYFTSPLLVFPTLLFESRERGSNGLSVLKNSYKRQNSSKFGSSRLSQGRALLDLPIALGIARRLGVFVMKKPALFMGELSLDGRLRKLEGLFLLPF